MLLTQEQNSQDFAKQSRQGDEEVASTVEDESTAEERAGKRDVMKNSWRGEEVVKARKNLLMLCRQLGNSWILVILW